MSEGCPKQSALANMEGMKGERPNLQGSDEHYVSTEDLCVSGHLLNGSDGHTDINDSSDTFTERRRSASTGESPAKMESCMFNFPIPTPRMWTIMVEPITRQAAGQPKLQHWRPKTAPVTGAELDSEKGASPACCSQTEAATIMESGAEAEEGSTRKRNRIYLNGECIDHGLRNKRSQKPKTDRTGERVFTFVADKRMPPAPDMNQPTIPSSRLVCIKTKMASPTSSDTIAASPRKPCRRGRKSGTKPLTFHQLEFNSETLKPFDRSIFTVKNPNPFSNDARPASSLLVEAAEILLELQSDADSSVSVPITSRNVPSVLDSPSTATAVLTN